MRTQFYLFLFLLSCSTTAPETPTPMSEKKTLWDKGAMVSAANPHAVNAAVDILNLGAVQLTQLLRRTPYWVWLNLKALVLEGEVSFLIIILRAET